MWIHIAILIHIAGAVNHWRHTGWILHDLQGNERARARPQDLLGRFEEVRRRDQLDPSAADMLKRDYV